MRSFPPKIIHIIYINQPYKPFKYKLVPRFRRAGGAECGCHFVCGFHLFPVQLLLDSVHINRPLLYASLELPHRLGTLREDLKRRGRRKEGKKEGRRGRRKVIRRGGKSDVLLALVQHKAHITKCTTHTIQHTAHNIQHTV